MDNEKILLTKKFLEHLVAHGATYASITLINKGGIKLFSSSNNKWEEIYHDSKLSSSCYLMKTGKKLLEKDDQFTVLWDSVNLSNDLEHELFDLRQRNNLCHGVSFAQKLPDGTLQAIGIAGHYLDKTFTRAIIENKQKILNNLKRTILF